MSARLRLRIAAAVLAAGLAGSPASGEEPITYLTGIEDLPLMPGLVEIGGATTVFDASSGRIVEAYAAGKVDRAAVADFYARTLPALGWRAEASSRFRRDDETLAIDFLDGGERLTVRFTINPD